MRVSRVKTFLGLLLINIVTILGLVYGFEFILRRTDPFINGLPFDTSYYLRNEIFYPELERPKQLHTWGIPVDLSDIGFRERDIGASKSAGVCRIMVLGDSFTWGVGLAEEDRYTNLVESFLTDAFPDAKFEVLNFGRRGVATVKERDTLLKYKEVVDPDLIVIGFVFNDTQPLSQDYSVEREQFEGRYGAFLESVLKSLVQIGLPQTAQTLRDAVDNIVVRAGFIPAWETALQRTYESDSTEWKSFVQALEDIKNVSDEMELSPPKFVVLNQLIALDHPTDYRDQDGDLPIYLKWYHQAELAAAEVGFQTFNFERELLEKVSPEEIPINEIDRHPSAKVNQIYAQKLFESIADDYRKGLVCGQ